MEKISEQLFTTLKHSCEKCQSDKISLSGGLDSTVLAYFLQNRKPEAIAVIAKDFEANDLLYCQMASQKFHLPLTILNPNTEKILEAIKETIQILKNFNNIEIRNNIVMYLAIKQARDFGSNRIITGDGADELFLGYNFLLEKSKEEIEREARRIYSIMHFPSLKIGKALGVKIESPFLDKKVMDLALSIPSNLKINFKDGIKYGKWIIRKTFEDLIPRQIAWREKSPMQDGAGTNQLTQLFENIISDSVFSHNKEKIMKEEGIQIRTKESMYYFDIYKKIHGGYQKESEEGTSCPYCHFNTENSKFCRMCGAFPI